MNLMETITSKLEEQNINLDSKTLLIVETVANAIEEWSNQRFDEYAKAMKSYLNDTYSVSIQNWIIDECGPIIEKWLREGFLPASLKFQYWAYKEFPNTFKQYLDNEEISPMNEESEDDNTNITDPDYYEEIDTDDNGSTE